MMNAAPRARRGLVIDDDSVSRRVVRRCLLPPPWLLDEAASSLEAWPLLERVDFDLVVLDLGLVEGEGGLGLLRRLKGGERTRGLPVAVLTGIMEEDILAEARRHADRLLLKPVANMAAARADLEALADSRAGRGRAAPVGPRLLAVDNEPGCRDLIRAGLEAAGFQCRVCATVREARRALVEDRFDLALLDYRLDDGDGLELCRFVRALPDGDDALVAILSHDEGLCAGDAWVKAGADTCWRKRTDMARLAALARGLLRRRPGGRPASVELAEGVRFLPAARLVVSGDFTSAPLSPREARLLELLVEARGKDAEGVLRREALRTAWDMEQEGADLALNQAIRWLRGKLAGLGDLLETVKEKGWRLRPGFKTPYKVHLIDKGADIPHK